MSADAPSHRRLAAAGLSSHKEVALQRDRVFRYSGFQVGLGVNLR